MELHEERQEEKSRVLLRRRAKFSKPKEISWSSHWSNHAGTYKDKDCRLPKYWHHRKQPRIFISIRNHHGLTEAIEAIQAGLRNQDQYHHVCGLYRERLRATQSLRDRGITYAISFLARAGFEELTELKDLK